MAKFFVKQDADYVVGHLRYGHREGYIEADSIEDAKKKGYENIFNYLVHWIWCVNHSVAYSFFFEVGHYDFKSA